MPIGKRTTRLDVALDDAPPDPGIYEFTERRGNDFEVIYIGCAAGQGGIRSRVLAHINGTSAGNPRVHARIRRPGSTVAVRWEKAGWLHDPLTMEAEALRAFILRHGRLPACNSRQELQNLGIWTKIKDLLGF